MIGQVKNHPEGKLAILLPLLDTSEYTVLGNPPSFDSITRDTYPTDKVFSSDFVLAVLKGISSAAVHLHQCGILHGDLYAHNILSKQNGNVLLTDFGAASLVSDVFDKEIAGKLEKIEVRAFGCLIDDLMSRINVSTGSQQHILEELRQLQNVCMLDSVDSRPTFREIHTRLENLIL
jgi:serine/threonine protein kinase